MRASMNQATLVLGSATPSVESFYKAERGEYGLLTLGRRAKKDSRLARVHVVDLRAVSYTHLKMLTRDLGTVLVGKDAVEKGLIDQVGGIREALAKLYGMIGETGSSGRRCV